MLQEQLQEQLQIQEPQIQTQLLVLKGNLCIIVGDGGGFGPNAICKNVECNTTLDRFNEHIRALNIIYQPQSVLCSWESDDRIVFGGDVALSRDFYCFGGGYGTIDETRRFMFVLFNLWDIDSPTYENGTTSGVVEHHIVCFINGSIVNFDEFLRELSEYIGKDLTETKRLFILRIYQYENSCDNDMFTCNRNVLSTPACKSYRQILPNGGVTTTPIPNNGTARINVSVSVNPILH